MRSQLSHSFLHTIYLESIDEHYEISEKKWLLGFGSENIARGYINVNIYIQRHSICIDIGWVRLGYEIWLLKVFQEQVQVGADSRVTYESLFLIF